MSKVALLTKADCPYCGLMRMFLQRHGIDFEELRIDEPQQQWLKVRMLEGGLLGLPALMYNNQIVPIGNNTDKALKTLRSWGLLEGGL